MKLHGLRHAAGSLIARTADPVFVRDFLGHSKLTTTNRYLSSRLRPEEFDRLDQAFAPHDSEKQVRHPGCPALPENLVEALCAARRGSAKSPRPGTDHLNARRPPTTERRSRSRRAEESRLEEATSSRRRGSFRAGSLCRRRQIRPCSPASSRFVGARVVPKPPLKPLPPVTVELTRGSQPPNHSADPVTGQHQDEGQRYQDRDCHVGGGDSVSSGRADRPIRSPWSVRVIANRASTPRPAPVGVREMLGSLSGTYAPVTRELSAIGAVHSPATVYASQFECVGPHDDDRLATTAAPPRMSRCLSVISLLRWGSNDGRSDPR